MLPVTRTELCTAQSIRMLTTYTQVCLALHRKIKCNFLAAPRCHAIPSDISQPGRVSLHVRDSWHLGMKGKVIVIP